MRQINFSDINRRLIQTLNFYDDKVSKIETFTLIRENFKLEATENFNNAILNKLLGGLTFRSKKDLIRILNRYCKNNTYDLLKIWSDLSKELLVYKDTIYVQLDKFEIWKKYFHALDEDLIVINSIISSGINKESFNHEKIVNIISKMKTFISPYEPQVALELQKGISIQHAHLTGCYPAPYYWVAVMNNRIEEEKILYNDKPEEDQRYYSIEDTQIIKNYTIIAKQIRVMLYEFIEEMEENKLDESNTIEKFEEFLKYVEYDLNSSFSKEELEDKMTRRKNEVNNLIQERRGQYNDYIFEYDTNSVSIDSPCICKTLVGERILLFNIIQYLYTTNSNIMSELVSKLFWIYIQAKNIFLSKIQQEEGTCGFDFFEYTLRTINWQKNKKEIEKFECEIGQFLQESKSVVKVEFMISPQESIKAYRKTLETIRGIQEEMNKNLSKQLKEKYKHVQVGAIVHFIKNEGDYLENRRNKDDNAYRIYHYTQRDCVKKQMEVLVSYKNIISRERTAVKIPIVAIDTANRELYCPPEVFGEIYKRENEVNFTLDSEVQFKGKTYHVGEDFEHIITGIRRIYEAIKFLDIDAGNRLGHCIALGADIQKWVENNGTVNISLIDLLDNALFEWHILKEGAINDYARISKLEQRIAEYSVEIYGLPINPQILVEAWLRRGDVYLEEEKKYSNEENIPYWIQVQGEIMKKCGREGTHNVINSLEMLGAVCSKYDIVVEETRINLPKDYADRILCEYLYDKHTIHKSIEIRTIDVTEELKYMERVQQLIISLLREKGITVESNPTSNWLIGGFENFSDIPSLQWIFRQDDISFTLNIDDPAVFANSIENEYYLVFATLLKGSSKYSGMSRIRALNEISKLRECSCQTSFLK